MKIKNHEILHEISRGALTTVYKARHLNLDRIVLLKVLNKQWLSQQDLLERFQREARISARLKHPGIVNVYDFEISAELVYISLEFVDGQTIADYIKQNHPIPFEKIVTIFNGVLDALIYAHAKGVIHRDLKPANILLDKSFHARLTDFGLASLIDVPGVTEQGHSMGTPAYMAPEQIKGEKCDQQSDLYSLGITIYELASGKSAFQKENTAATLHSVLSDSLADLRNIRQDIPAEFIKIIELLTQKEKSLRPENASLVLKLLGKDIPAKLIKHESPVPFRKTVHRSLLAFSTALTIFLLFFYFRDNNEMPVQEEMHNFQKQDSTALQMHDLIQNHNDSAASAVPKIIKTENNALESPFNELQNSSAKNQIAGSLKKNESTGKLFIVCNPWAVVKVNGDSLDTTPLKQQILLSEGKHILELSNPNFKTIHHEYEINAGDSDTLYFQLEPAFGYLMIRVTPWAKLFVNENYQEDTPLEKPLTVQAGRNIIRLINPGLGTITDTIYIEAGRTVEKHFTFAN